MSGTSVVRPMEDRYVWVLLVTYLIELNVCFTASEKRKHMFSSLTVLYDRFVKGVTLSVRVGVI